MLAFDAQGVVAIVTAVFAGVASVIAAWNARSASQIKTSISTNGDSREIGQIASDVAKSVAPDPTPAAPPYPAPPAPATPPPEPAP